jgi:uncharacterized membrane protein
MHKRMKVMHYKATKFKLYVLILLFFLGISSISYAYTNGSFKDQEVKVDSADYNTENKIIEELEDPYEKREEYNPANSVMYLNLLYYLYTYFVEKRGIDSID